MLDWTDRVAIAVERVGTPCYVTAWSPVRDALERLDRLRAPVAVRSWLSFKTHPLPALAEQWLRSRRGVEVVSERELSTIRALGARVDSILINGVGKQSWLPKVSAPGLRVHFDSLHEIDRLLPWALAHRWRVGIRVQAPDECDRREPQFNGQFGLTPEEAIAAFRTLRAAGADVQSVHFHLGQRRQDPGAYLRGVERAVDVCDEAGVAPRFIDCGGGLPGPSDPALGQALQDLSTAMFRASEWVPSLEEIWIENGRFVTEAAAVLAVRVVDVKDRPDCRYLICDGGRTNHALAADTRPHPLLLLPARNGPRRLTTVCGPTCMTDDRLGRWMLPETIEAGDIIVWLEAGAYHLPWETRFSHGLSAIVWFDDREQPVVARTREGVTEACIAQ